jgi:hypothetical protein
MVRAIIAIDILEGLVIMAGALLIIRVQGHGGQFQQ